MGASFRDHKSPWSEFTPLILQARMYEANLLRYTLVHDF